MSFFDFLKPDGFNGQIDPSAFSGQINPQMEPQPTATTLGQQPVAPAVQAPSALLQAPVQTAQGPGFLDHFRTPNDQGVTWADKLYAIGSILGKDDAGGMKYLQGVQDRAQKVKDTASKNADAAKLKTKSSAAFRAALQHGKFDPATYATMMDDDFDPKTMEKLAGGVKASAPPANHIVSTADGIYSVDPTTNVATSLTHENPKHPFGWDVDAKTGAIIGPTKNGPFDPAVIARTSGLKRDAIVSRPMPHAAGAGAGNGLPAGAKVIGMGHL